MEIFVQSSSDLGHHLAQAPVDHFERGLSVQLHNANLSEVDATSVSCHVDLSTVRDLENLLTSGLVKVSFVSQDLMSSEEKLEHPETKWKPQNPIG